MRTAVPAITSGRTKVWLACVLILLGFTHQATTAENRVLDDPSWLADIDTVANSIREIHPRPFRTVSRNEFDEAHQKLIRDVPDLSDKEIIVRIATLVGLINDGHTRLSIPRQHPTIGLEFGHTATAGPDHAELEFRQLPVAFAKFTDGVFVIAATSEHSDLIGLQLTGIDGNPIGEVLDAVQELTFAENSQLEALMSVDRLTLIEALEILGASHSSKNLTLELIDSAGTEIRRTVRAMQMGPVEWVDAFARTIVPLRMKHPGKAFWSEHVRNEDFIYMQLDEITNGEISLAEFVVNTVETAGREQARLVIDLRNNFGGSADLNKTLVMALIRSDELNQYGRTFVLIGRRTFSAAQMLANELEQYTRVSFVGEPTGSRPDHFGDPKKIRLQHSGLTLRVSRLHWSAPTAFDERESTFPDFPIQWTSNAYFAGDDPALELAVSLQNIDLKSLLRAALQRRDIQQIGRYALDAMYSPTTFSMDYSSVFVDLAKEFDRRGDAEATTLTYRVGEHLYPGKVSRPSESRSPGDEQ